MIKVGDRFESNEGCLFEIVDILGYNNIKISFQDAYQYTIHITMSELRALNIRNPFHPRVKGVGFIGVGKYGAKSKTTNGKKVFERYYTSWLSMLNRCYGKNQQSCYEGVIVNPIWHNLQNFADWYETEAERFKDYKGKIQLDKDILGDSMIYSPDMCSLVPAEINSLMVSKPETDSLPCARLEKDGKYSVYYNRSKFEKTFDTEIEAHEFYLVLKSATIRESAQKFRDYLSPNVYETLITKDFRYKFSPYFKNTQPS